MNSTKQPTLPKALQHHAQPAPLAPDILESLRHIELLNVSAFHEAEVYTHVMEPLVRALGYLPADVSASQEESLPLPEEKEKKKKHKNKPSENSPKLWKEDFWLMEARRPKPNEEAFPQEALKQALASACHPALNAALVVLCDGVKIEVFERETSVTEPALSIACKHLASEFHKLHALLGPQQKGFFQQRRLLRLLDKAFAFEFNLGHPQAQAPGNTRTLLWESLKQLPTSDSQAEAQLGAASVEALVEVHMFQQHSTRATHALLAALADKNPAELLPYMLPKQVRVISDIYMGHALACLMEWSRRGLESLECLPPWLDDASMPGDLKAAIRKLFRLCLSYFDGDEPRRLSLLASATCRRLAKAQFVLSEMPWAVSQVLHFMCRLQLPQQSFRQMADALESHALAMLNASARMATESLLAPGNAFNVETTQLQLQKLWEAEKQCLAQAEDYPKRSAAWNWGETHTAESCCVSFDFLGHMALCLLQLFPEWKDEVLQNHPLEVTALAQLGSWAAQKLLGLQGDTVAPPEEAFLADRFFLGEVETLRFLRAKYSGQAANTAP